MPAAIVHLMESIRLDALSSAPPDLILIVRRQDGAVKLDARKKDGTMRSCLRRELEVG